MDVLPSKFSKAPGNSGTINKPKHNKSSVQNLYSNSSINPIINANETPHIKIVLFLSLFILFYSIR